MTVSQISLNEMTESPQQQQHWPAEQVLNWSRVPVVHVRSTIFIEPFFCSMAASSIAKDGTIRFPFGSARTSPISASDVARVVSTILDFIGYALWNDDDDDDDDELTNYDCCCGGLSLTYQRSYLHV